MFLWIPIGLDWKMQKDAKLQNCEIGKLQNYNIWNFMSTCDGEQSPFVFLVEMPSWKVRDDVSF